MLLQIVVITSALSLGFVAGSFTAHPMGVITVGLGVGFVAGFITAHQMDGHLTIGVQHNE